MCLYRNIKYYCINLREGREDPWILITAWILRSQRLHRAGFFCKTPFYWRYSFINNLIIISAFSTSDLFTYNSTSLKGIPKPASLADSTLSLTIDAIFSSFKKLDNPIYNNGTISQNFYIFIHISLDWGSFPNIIVFEGTSVLVKQILNCFAGSLRSCLNTILKSLFFSLFSLFQSPRGAKSCKLKTVRISSKFANSQKKLYAKILIASLVS